MKELNSKKSERHLYVILSISLLIYVGSNAWDIIFPDIVESVNGDVVLWGWAIAAYNLSQFLFQIPNAKLSDIYGRKIIIILSMVFFIIGNILILLSKKSYIIILARFIQGIGAISGVILAATADYATDNNRGIAVAGRNLTQTLGWVAGMIFGGIISDHFGIDSMIFICVVLGFFVIVTSYVGLPSKKRTKGLSSPSNRDSFSKELKSLLKIPTFKFGMIFSAIRYFFYQAIVSYLIWYLKDYWEMKSTERSLFLLPVIFFYIIGLFTAGKILKKKKIPVSLIAFSFCLISLSCFFLFTLEPFHGRLILMLCISIIGFSFGLAHTTLTTILLLDIPKKSHGVGSGISMTLSYGMIIIAPLIMASMNDLWGVNYPFLLISALSMLSGIFVFFIRNFFSSKSVISNLEMTKNQ